MYSLLILVVSSFTLSLLLTPLARNLCNRRALLDWPDRTRKLHAAPIPRVGGSAIFAACVLSIAILILLPLKGGKMVHTALPLVWKLVPAAALVFAVGFLDDLFGLGPLPKLCGQVSAAALACWAGLNIHSVAHHALTGWWTVPLTIFWLIGCTNAFNLIDGLDGLAAGLGLLASVTTLLAALLQGNAPLAFATAPLVGALLGFLRFNFNPATVFLGDSGSLTIGFLLGCYGVIWSQKSATLLGMTAPLMALSIPLLDTLLAMGRRFLRARPIFAGDRGHIHHRLLERGLTPRAAALLLYGFCALGAAASLLASMARNQFRGLVVLLFCAMVWFGLRRLGYAEFGLARRMLMVGTFRRLLNAQLSLSNFQKSLGAASSMEEAWATIYRSYRDFGFHAIDLRINGHFYHDQSRDSSSNAWTIRITLSDSEYVTLNRDADSDPPAIVAPFADSLGAILRQKLPQLRVASAAAMNNASDA